MSISVVIPTYNRARLLKRALNSVASQTSTPDLVIICDNDSDDHTKEVVAEFEKKGLKIKYHKHNDNLGMLKNWEYAVNLVETEYFSILADDDFLLPNFIETGLAAFSENPGLGMWCGVTICVDENSKPILLAPSNLDAIGKYQNFKLLTHLIQHPASTATIFSKAVFENAGGFRKESVYLADLSIMLRISAISNILIDKTPVAVYSASGTYSKTHLFESWYPGCLDIFDQLLSLGLGQSFSYRRYVARTFYISCVDLRHDLFNDRTRLKSKQKVFSLLFKYLHFDIILISIYEAVRMRYYGIRNKIFKTDADEFLKYCLAHDVVKNIERANECLNQA
jgi:glycosyltransferase involved in cell wall biosynthesis